MSNSKKNVITERIREDYGTLTHFCKKHNLNYNTTKAVIIGVQRSPKITKLLIKLGYIKNGTEIDKSRNAYDKIKAKKEEKIA